MSGIAALPEALQPWRPWLDGFAPELAATLGELLTRIDPWLGRFQGRAQGGDAEPDGLGDLRRRGAYERLLTTEWLLADELPDEFLRRAAGGEHLFLAPRLRAQKSERLIVALFDAGPRQLGLPRLAQLALWILLARRASAAGGELRWGVLQRPGELHAAATIIDLRRLLDARSVERATTAHWHAWADALEQRDAAPGECWLIGHAPDGAARNAALPTQRLRITDSLDGESLELELRGAGPARRLMLPRPDAKPAARLLRGQFAEVVATPEAHHRQRTARLSLRLDPIISANGGQVAVPLLDGRGVQIVWVGDKRKLNKVKMREQYWSAGCEPIAMAFDGNTLGAILSRSEGLQFWQRGGLGVQPRPPREAFEASPGRGALLPCAWLRGEPGAQYVYALDAGGRLVYWAAPSGRGPLLLDESVLAFAKAGPEALTYLVVEEGLATIRFAVRTIRQKHRIALSVRADPKTRAFITNGGDHRDVFGGCALRLAVDQGREHWRIYVLPDRKEPRGDPIVAWEALLPPGARAIGLVWRRGDPALVVLGADRRHVILQKREAADAIYTAPMPIERISVNDATGTLAMLTAARELHVRRIDAPESLKVFHAAADRGADVEGE